LIDLVLLDRFICSVYEYLNKIISMQIVGILEKFQSFRWILKFIDLKSMMVCFFWSFIYIMFGIILECFLTGFFFKWIERCFVIFLYRLGIHLYLLKIYFFISLLQEYFLLKNISLKLVLLVCGLQTIIANNFLFQINFICQLLWPILGAIQN
jgi:hypothetical protein